MTSAPRKSPPRRYFTGIGKPLSVAAPTCCRSYMWITAPPLGNASPRSFHRCSPIVPAKTVDHSVGYKLLPFFWQQADDGYEVNLLWQLVHVREQKTTTAVALLPLWQSERRGNTPTQWQILGGFFLARQCNYDTKTSRLYLFRMIPLGGRTPFATTATTSPNPLFKPAS